MKTIQSTYKALLGFIAIALMAIIAYGNGGPFVVKYPNGDPSAKGVFAKMDFTLHPAREKRLRVIKEDLSFRFAQERRRDSNAMPLVTVIASYAIENPTQKEISVVFGFPILRGIYVLPYSMDSGGPDIKITVDGEKANTNVISNSKIYGIIRQGARDSIDEGIKTDGTLARLIDAVRKASGIEIETSKLSSSDYSLIDPRPIMGRSLVRWNSGIQTPTRIKQESIEEFRVVMSPDEVKGNSPQAPPSPATPPPPATQPPPANPYPGVVIREGMGVNEVKGNSQQPSQTPPAAIVPTEDYEPARERLRKYLIEKKHWNDRNAALLVEYAGLDLGKARFDPADSWRSSLASSSLMRANLGPLSAIGEQKATQFFAQIASRFDKNAAEAYESIFSAWGGDVRDRSVDLDSGKVRLREIDIKDPQDRKTRQLAGADNAIYARVNYLDPNAKISPTEKAACQTILKNLPVVFTFAPMNLLRYQVLFQPQQTRNVTVAYSQYAYLDTHGASSYQLAYVLHPASLWNDFGPIHIKIQTPEGVACRASVPLGPGSEIPSDKAFARVTTISGQTPYNNSAGIEIPAYPLIQFEARLDKSKEKTGELFLAVGKAEWEAFAKAKK
jgi:hypothetical protein